MRCVVTTTHVISRSLRRPSRRDWRARAAAQRGSGRRSCSYSHDVTHVGCGVALNERAFDHLSDLRAELEWNPKCQSMVYAAHQHSGCRPSLVGTSCWITWSSNERKARCQKTP